MTPSNDTFTIRAVVIIVGFIVSLATVGTCVLAYQGKMVPQVIGLIITGGTAGLIGILASIKVNPQPPADPPVEP